MPFSNNVKVSNENVEKVVNPPHNPVFKKRWICEDKYCFSNKPTTTPMIKAPSKFVINVKTGKELLIGNKLKVYLKMDPMAPPSPTHKNLSIVTLHCDNTKLLIFFNQSYSRRIL